MNVIFGHHFQAFAKPRSDILLHYRPDIRNFPRNFHSNVLGELLKEALTTPSLRLALKRRGLRCRRQPERNLPMDVSVSGANPFTHYDTVGWRQGRNPDALFDTNYYMEHNPDVKAAAIDPMLHYEQYGWKEDRDPGAQFSTSKYLAANADVKGAGANPLVHYEQYGIREGRPIFRV